MKPIAVETLAGYANAKLTKNLHTKPPLLSSSPDKIIAKSHIDDAFFVLYDVKMKGKT